MNIKRNRKSKELLKEYKGTKKYLPYMIVSLLVCSSFIFSACNEKELEETKVDEVFQGMEEEVVIECDIPSQYPHIVINRNGYEEVDDKIVLVTGANLPKTFQVISEETGESIFEGAIVKSRYDPTLNRYSGYGDFTKVMEKGDYYITSENLGRSYSFQIKSQLHEEKFNNVFEQMYEKIKTQSSTKEEICDSAVTLLLTYEIYGDTYEDGSYFAKNKIPETLDLIGLLVDQLVLEQNSEDGSVGGITDKYAGILAWYSYLYKEYNTTRATEYLKLADLAWNFSKDQKGKINSDVVHMNELFAVAQLYRASGKYVYHTEFKSRANDLDCGIIVNYPYGFYGGLAYVSTNKSIDINWCADFMDALAKKAEDIVDVEHQYQYVIREEENVLQVYEDSGVILVANYINKSMEYEEVIKNRYHYISGCNMFGKQLEISDELLQYSYWYMILDQVK